MNLKIIILAAASTLLVTPVLAESRSKEEMNMEAMEVVQSYFDYLKKGDLESLGNLFDDNIVWHQPGNGQLSGIYHGKQKLFSLFSEFMQRSGGTFKIDEVQGLMVNENLVVAYLHFSAHRDEKSISMDGVDVMKVENGKITEVYLFSGDQDAEDEFWNQIK